MNFLGWEWDNGSKAHFGFGLTGGLLGLGYNALFAIMFLIVEFIDWAVIDTRGGETYDAAESFERTKEEFFEFFFGSIIGAFARLLFLAFGLAI